MLDGLVPRKTGTANELGEKLDSTADFVFAAICLFKFLPAIGFPGYLWVWTVLSLAWPWGAAVPTEQRAGFLCDSYILKAGSFQF